MTPKELRRQLRISETLLKASQSGGIFLVCDRITLRGVRVMFTGFSRNIPCGPASLLNYAEIQYYGNGRAGLSRDVECDGEWTLQILGRRPMKVIWARRTGLGLKKGKKQKKGERKP